MKRSSVVLQAGNGWALVAIAAAATVVRPHVANADPRLMDYGQHLSQECTTCHRKDGTDNGIPAIIGREADHFVETMRFYQSGARDNPVMVSVARSLDDEQLRALAIYFGSLKPAPKVDKSPDPPAKKKR